MKTQATTTQVVFVEAPVSEMDVLELALMDLRSGRMAPFVVSLDAEDLPDFGGAGYEEQPGFDESRYPWRY